MNGLESEIQPPTQFSAFRAEEVGMNQNGKLVLGESIGDLGGLKIAWLAFQKSLEGKPVQL